jgi:hypothetical protein
VAATAATRIEQRTRLIARADLGAGAAPAVSAWIVVVVHCGLSSKFRRQVPARRISAIRQRSSMSAKACRRDAKSIT